MDTTDDNSNGVTEPEDNSEAPELPGCGPGGRGFESRRSPLVKLIERDVRAAPEDIEDACSFAWIPFFRYQPDRERNWKGWLYDGGLFDPAGRDERLLPFEGHGAVSTSQLKLPNAVRLFDYDTIADVVLHLRYTAREAGALEAKAVEHLESRFGAATGVGSVRLFSVRHEFPGAWTKFKASGRLDLDLRDEHYPFWSQSRLGAVKGVQLYAQTKSTTLKAGTEPFVGAGGELPGLVKCRLTSPLAAPIGEFTLNLSETTIDELWISIAWAKS